MTPAPGTRSLTLFLYADVYTPGTLTTNEYSDVVVRRSPVLLQPVVVATSQRRHGQAPALYTGGGSFSPEWIGPAGETRVEVDGLRNGWLGLHPGAIPLRFGPSSWYLISRFGSLLAVALLLVLALSLWRGRHWAGRGGTAQPDRTDIRMRSEAASLHTRLGPVDCTVRKASSPSSLPRLITRRSVLQVEPPSSRVE